MAHPLQGACRYFATYSGVKLPIKLSQELEESAIENRNTFFKGYFDAKGRMTAFQKIVYGEVEMQHAYVFDENGQLKQAEIANADGETTLMRFE